MARVAQIGDQQWMEIADELAAVGTPPTVRSVAAAGKERYGVSASFTTIQSALDSWRRLGGTNRPKTDAPAFAALIYRTIQPLYQQLLDRARSEFEPLVLVAEERATAAEAERDGLRQLATTLRETIEHLRAEAIAAERRHDEARADYRARLEALEAHNALLLRARSDDDARYAAIVTTIESLKAKRP